MQLASAHAAVIAQPRADAPRERFADLVASTEPATAAFVRAQLAVAAKRRAAGRRDRAVEALAIRCLAPPPEQDARGTGVVTRLLGSSVPASLQRMAWGRGFLERLTVDAAWFTQRGPELMALAPIVDVTVHLSPCDPEELFDSPAWTHVRSLRFVGPPLAMPVITALTRSPYLSRLAMLDLSYARLPEAAIHLVAEAGGLGGLKYLIAAGNGFPDVNRSVDEEDGVVYGEKASQFAAQLATRHGARLWFNGIPSELEPHPETFG